MASANLQFKIGSTFTGEGFKNAQNACKDVKASLAPAITAANSMATALGGMDTSATKAFAAVTNLVGAFAQGGVQGAVMAAAMTALNGYIDKMKEKAEAATKAANDLTAAVNKGFSDALNDRIKTITSSVDRLRTDFDTITSQANAFRDAMNGLQSSRAEGSAIAIQIEKFNAMLEADSEEMKKDIEATYNLKIAKEKAQAAEEEATAKVEAASEARKQSEARYDVITQQLVDLEGERCNLERQLNEIASENKDKRKEISSKLEALADKRATLETELNNEGERTKTLLVKEETAIQDASNAHDKMTIAVKEAELKIKDLQFDKAEELNQANEDYMKKLQEISKENFEKLNKELEKNKQELTKANAKVETAVNNMNAAVKAFNENFVVNEIAAGIQRAMNPAVNGLNNVNNALLGNAQGIAKGAAKVAGQAAIDKGLVKTVAELKGVEDKAFKDAMTKINSTQTTQMGLEAQRAARLEKMGKAISETDKKWLENYNKVREGNLKQVKAVEEAKQAVKDAKARQQKVADNLERIVDKLADSMIEDKIESVKTTVDTSAEAIIAAIESKEVNVTVENNNSGESSGDSSSIDVSGIESGLATINTSLGEIKGAIEDIEFPETENDDSSDSDSGSNDIDVSGIEGKLDDLKEKLLECLKMN